MTLDRRRILLYGVLPLLLGLTLVGLYFSGWTWAQELMAPDGRREYGLLETLQLVVIAWIVATCWRAGRRELARGPRLTWRGLALFAAVVLLEEIDYGITWYESLRGVPWEERAEVRNVHNQGDIVSPLKRVVDAGLVVLYGVLPWLSRRFPERWARLLPDRHSILTIAGALVVRALAHRLEDAGVPHNGGLDGNFAEFRELFTYLLPCLHLREVAARRDWSAPGATDGG